ncbi:hypothetical protein CDN99_08140 [Roseateles aquatilis]|uniref:Phosphodiester glycosidase domain-containing protein n=1 Tax=Roseateles aquatilis TaxID=431061 RepID=A0A246JIE7_9BURK|nr:phosphodiester glycosidase family protein [Roseateles aquatilis]OWQ92293.1 hypothetical protein CDN99_08140 [Roseateles aquatilis]
MLRITAVVLLALTFGPTFAAVPAPQSGSAYSPLPLGNTSLPQKVTKEILANGVTHYRFKRGSASSSGHWMLMSEPLASAEGVTAALACFRELGVADPVIAAHRLGVSQDYQVASGGRFETRISAQREELRAKRAGCTLVARHTSEDESNVFGPWVVDVVEIASDAPVELKVVAGPQGSKMRQRTSVLSKAAGAIVAVNAGFFVEEGVDGYPGQAAGISVVDGQLESGPVAARSALVIHAGKEPAAKLVKDLALSLQLVGSDGTRIKVDGVNRKPGLARNCGRDGNDFPLHDYTCKYEDDAVYFPRGSGFIPLTSNLDGSARRFAIDREGVLSSLKPGDAAAPGDAMMVVTPASARLQEMERMASAGTQVRLVAKSAEKDLFSAGSYAVNGGPVLIRVGQEIREEVEEGWSIGLVRDSIHDLHMHEWVNRRNPRTAFGIKDDGTLLLLTVDGHRHGTSVGMTIEELRQVMKSLGARDAINLDGGGSTAMVLSDKLVNLPSDLTGERAIGDALLFVPRKNVGKWGNP